MDPVQGCALGGRETPGFYDPCLICGRPRHAPKGFAGHCGSRYNNHSRQIQPELAQGLPGQTKISAFVTKSSDWRVLPGLT